MDNQELGIYFAVLIFWFWFFASANFGGGLDALVALIIAMLFSMVGASILEKKEPPPEGEG